MLETKNIFSIATSSEFQESALEMFRFQYQHNKVYRQFCKLLRTDPRKVNAIGMIPFLPIQFFKSHEVVSTERAPQIVFTSSGTSGDQTSRHSVPDLGVYKESFRKGFEHFYGNIEDYTILALLPSYLEREGSSLIYMVQDLIEKSKNEDSGFYLHNYEALKERMIELDQAGKKILLIGVSFALLDLVEKYSFDLKNTIVMETGGMKGRRKELIRKELHKILSQGFGVEHIHSEYGMTELLSQAYSGGEGIFKCPPWMKVLIRDPEDALQLFPQEKTGGMNIIDLANKDSCSFIATQDLGKILMDGKVEILGRFDNSDIRGCNLMVL